MLSLNRMPGPFLSLDNQKVLASRWENPGMLRDKVNHSPDSPAQVWGILSRESPETERFHTAWAMSRHTR